MDFGRIFRRKTPSYPGANLSETVSACNVNAKDLVTSAVAVAKKNNFGAALSLMILAYEEAMKGLIYHSVDQGWATFDPKKAGKPGFVDEKLLRNHPLKQYLIFMFDLSVHGFALGVRDEVDAGRDPDVHPPWLVRWVVQEASLDPLHTWMFSGLKNRGLYVEKGPAGLLRPSDVTREELESLGSRIVLRLRLVEGLERMPLTPTHKAEIRKQAFESGPTYDAKFLKVLQKRQRSVGTERFVKEMVQAHNWLLEPLRPRD